MKVYLIHGSPSILITVGDDGIVEKVEPGFIAISALGRKAEDVLLELAPGTVVDVISFNKL